MASRKVKPGDPESVAEDRAKRLFHYIQEIAKLQTRVVRDILNSSSYEELLWLGKLPDDSECKSVVRSDPGLHPGEWLIVERPPFTTPPDVPEELEPWLELASVRDSSTALAINDTATIIHEEDGADGLAEMVHEQQSLDEQPDIEELFDLYRDEWHLWAEEDQRLGPIHDVYASLYQMHQRSTDLEEMYEVVLGLGLATKQVGRSIVRRPLLIAKADIEFDDQSGRLTVSPAGDGMNFHIEAEMFEEDDLPEREVVAKLSIRLEDVDDPLEPDAVDSILNSWVNSSGTTARYVDTLLEPRVEETLVVGLAPVLMLRRRTRRAVVDFCEQVLGQLEAGVDRLPPSVSEIIEVAEDRSVSGSEEAGGTAVDEPLFPLPANDEQREIVERLGRATGIVVEGPPGTGKSHTIANLIAHLTAHGQRVLVTSHTARALTVLKGKLPDGVADLCVDVLGEGRERRDSLERSVTALLARHSDPEWGSARINKRLQEKTAERDAARARRSELVAEQRRAREFEIELHDPGIEGYRGSASAVAARVWSEEGDWDWLLDEPQGPPPDALSDAMDLLQAERSTTPADEEAAALTIPVMDEIPDPAAVRKALADIAERQKRAADLSVQAEDVSKAVSAADSDRRRELESALQNWTAARVEALRRQGAWIRDGLDDLGKGQDRKWMELEKQTRGVIDHLGDSAGNLDRAGVTGVTPENRSRLRLQAVVLRDHLVSGGAMSRFGRRPDPVKQGTELLESTRVGASPPDTAGRLELLIRWIDADAELDQVFAAWGGHLKSGGATFADQRIALTDQLDDLEALMAVDAARKAVDRSTEAILGLDSPDWSDDDGAMEFVDAVRLGQAMAAADDAQKLLDAETELLRNTAIQRRAAPAVAEAEEALDAGDPAAYAAAYGSLEDLHRTRQRVQTRDALRRSVGEVMPKTVESIVASASDEVWDQRIPSISQAWEWRRAGKWLIEAQASRDEGSIGSDLIAVEKRIESLTGGIAEHMAWGATIGRLDKEAQQNLRAYQAAMRAYGKGTGKHAQRHLRDARVYLDACQDAVPVWIMPTHVVAETIQPKPGLFDVVIVDESSQSGVDSSFLLWLGKKVIIVGDDRQISPDSVGIDRNAATRLADTYLADFRLKSVLGVENSLFTQATVRYQDRIRLREHFRCMPEIIDFSNKIAYADQPLIPLRQYGSERLEPLVARFVEGAETAGSPGNRRNEHEAEQIVSTIKRLIDDPAYAGKTMGVVSMLGSAQSKLIDQLLVREISPSEISGRKIRSGDAYAFQGDERDVMFLSLVVTPPSDGSTVKVATERTFLQRYNVACSRAKDQEWLFHSVSLSDLKTHDLRRKLVAHFVAPTSEQREREIADVPDDRLIDPFESIFEQLVYKDIRRRGFRIEPQVRVHDYRIDLVVIGRDRRLAVECDGDFWHGPERYAADDARQRDLQRCGWSFVRIRGSAYFGDPVAALEPLWATLEDYQIYPVGEEPERDVAAKPADERVFDAEELERAPDWVPSADASGVDVVPPRRAAKSGAADEELSDTAEEKEAPDERSRTSGVARYEPWGSAGTAISLRASREAKADVLVEIVDAEGPIDRELLLKRYVRATGKRRVTRASKEPLLDALESLIAGGRIAADELLVDGTDGWTILRKPRSIPIVIRERGNRDLVEIPANEVAAMMVAMSASSGVIRGEALKRATLDTYGRTRLTERASNYLDHCAELMSDRRVLAAGRALAEVIGQRVEHREEAVLAEGDRPTASTAELLDATIDEEPLDAQPFEPEGLDELVGLEPEEEDETVGAGPPFWDLVLSTVRDAEALSSKSVDALGALWGEADGDVGIEDMRSMAIDLGAESEWVSVAKFVASNLPGTEGHFRGAVVDIAYLAYWRSHRSRDEEQSELTDWPKRLERAWRSAVAAAESSPRTKREQELCIHGEPHGQCLYIACSHHPLGGIDLRSEM